MKTFRDYILSKNNPSNREQGTSFLRNILRVDTPGQEGYNSSQIGNTYGEFELGCRVRFSHHDKDVVDGDEQVEREGTVIQSDLQDLLVRLDNGFTYNVRHKDAQKV